MKALLRFMAMEYFSLPKNFFKWIIYPIVHLYNLCMVFIVLKNFPLNAQRYAMSLKNGLNNSISPRACRMLGKLDLMGQGEGAQHYLEISRNSNMRMLTYFSVSRI